jgi:hypothetical protein
MASLFGNSAFTKAPTAAQSGNSRAVKLADIYLKGRTNSAGVISDPAAYDQAIAMLQPYADDLNVQKKIATLQNQQKAVQAKNVDQGVTLSAFKRGVAQSIYSTNDGARDISGLAFNTSVKLDDALTSLNVAIAQLEEQGKSTDQLQDYRADLSKLANAQRDLVNKFNTGTADPSLDGYGYYVHTNPADGSIIGAALLPTSLAPDEVKGGLKRLANSTKLGNSTLPVYVSANQLADGTYSARVGNKTFISDGNNKETLVSADDSIKEDDSFDIKDTNIYPLTTTNNSLKQGQFGRMVVGQDNGETKFAYFYKGADNVIRTIDSNSIDKIKNDPLLSQKLNGYVPLLNPDEVSTYQNVQQFDDRSIHTASLHIADDNARAGVAQADAQMKKADTFFNKIPDAVHSVDEAVTNSGIWKTGNEVLHNTVGAAGRAIQGFFSKKNEPDKPNTPAPEQGNPTSIIDKGKSFFRNLA